MIDLFYMGGPLFMTLLTLALIAVFAVAAYALLKKKKEVSANQNRSIELVRQVGLFALVLGLTGQAIGLFSAFQAIEEWGQVSAAMLAGGLKVSSVTTLYGAFIFLIAYLLYFGMTYRAKNNLVADSSELN